MALLLEGRFSCTDTTLLAGDVTASVSKSLYCDRTAVHIRRAVVALAADLANPAADDDAAPLAPPKERTNVAANDAMMWIIVAVDCVSGSF